MSATRIRIGTISNYYGGLYVKEEDGRFFWGIENYDGIDESEHGWREISRRLYYTLLEEKEIKD